jgi:hypothetical protein
VVRTPEGCHRFSDTRSGCGIISELSGGLRYAPTTGYYLTALQAEAHSLTQVVLTYAHISGNSGAGFTRRPGRV